MKLASAFAVPLFACLSVSALTVLPATSAVAQSYTATYDVSDQAGLLAALKVAQSGSLIRLAMGDYGDINLYNRNFGAGRVTIASANAAASATTERPTFASLTLQTVSGLIFSGVDVVGTAHPLVNIHNGSSDIIFSAVRFYGNSINQDPWDDENTGLWIRGSSRITIFSCLFQDLSNGSFIQRSDKVTYMRNTLRHTREGLNLAAISNSRVILNHFHSFAPRYGDGEHPDAIQGWTTNETVGLTNVEISSNAIITGGDKAVQGIFIRSQTEENPEGPQVVHKSLKVAGNIYFGSSVHGITLGSVESADVRNNVVVASPWGDRNSSERAADGHSSGGYQPGIRGYSGRFNNFSRNISMAPIGGDSSGNRTENVDVYDVVQKAGVPWTNILPTRPTTSVPAITSFITLAGTTYATDSIGVIRTFGYGFYTERVTVTLPRAISAHMK